MPHARSVAAWALCEITLSKAALAIIAHVLIADVQIASRNSGGTYGAPTTELELCASGERSRTKPVAKIMRKTGLVTTRKTRRRVCTTSSQHAESVAPNRPARPFTVEGVAVNMLLVGAINYIPMRESYYTFDGPLSQRAALLGRGHAGYA